MAEEWLIDGYNLLHACAAVKDRTQFPSDRPALLSVLAGFTAQKGRPMLVVMDGFGDPGELDIHTTNLFHVVYSQKVSADTCIERILYERRAAAHFTVVTDDRAITNIARGGGAAVIGTSGFLEMLKELRKESDQAQDRKKIDSHGFNRPFEDKLKDL